MSTDRDRDFGFAPALDVPIAYLQRIRDYYVGLGYGAPYQWAHYAEVPFQALGEPLAQCRVALVTTAAPYQPDKGDQGPGAPYNAAAKFYAVYSGDTARELSAISVGDGYTGVGVTGFRHLGEKWALTYDLYGGELDTEELETVDAAAHDQCRNEGRRGDDEACIGIDRPLDYEWHAVEFGGEALDHGDREAVADDPARRLGDDEDDGELAEQEARHLAAGEAEDPEARQLAALLG